MADDGYDTEYGDSWDGDDECMSRRIGDTPGEDAFIEISSTRAGALEGARIYTLMIEYQMLHVSPNDVPPSSPRKAA